MTSPPVLGTDASSTIGHTLPPAAEWGSIAAGGVVDAVLIALDVKAILTPPCLFH
jgi:hypothetical protein